MISQEDSTILEAARSAFERATDIEALCWSVQDPIAEFGFPDCVLYVRHGNVLTQMSATGPKRLSGNRVANRIALTIGQGVVGHVAAAAKPRYVADTSKDPSYVYDVTGGRSEMAVPVIYAEEVIGILDCEHPDRDGLTERQQQLLLALADCFAPHLGAFIERSSRRGAQLLSEVTADLARRQELGSGEMELVFPLIAEQAAKALRAGRVNIWTIERPTDTLICREHFDLQSGQHSLLPPLNLAPLTAYREALNQERVLVANEAVEDGRTSELAEAYLQPNQVTAMLDAPVRVAGQIVGVVCVEHTVTARRWQAEEATFVATLADFVALVLLQAQKAAAERQLLQAQKLESLGRLASGVAHDFNNVLTVVRGTVDTLLGSKSLSSDDRVLLETIGEAGERASHLTRQLLAFGRQQKLTLEKQDVVALVERVARFLRSGISESVQIYTSHAGPLLVNCDESQIEQVLTNLVINASDAMPDGGAIHIETRRQGELAVIDVADEGEGVTEADREKIFDPFFTTKGDAGSGLGLAVSLGIVEQHGGAIAMSSESGRGSVFSVRLPLSVSSVADADVAPQSEIPHNLPVGPVVVVEDEPGVRDVMQQMLELLGIDVQMAACGDEALALVRELQPTLLITDVVMPGMNGPELFAAAREISPGLRVLFVSGYSRDLLGDLPWPRGEYAFLPKPFTVRSLAQAVADISEASAVPGG